MIDRLLKAILRHPVRRIRRYRAKHALNQLKSHEHPKVRLVGDALHETLANITSDEEQGIISLIEKRRNFLLAQTKHIAVVDYGAVSGNSKRTKEEMASGVRFMAPISGICKASKSKFWVLFLFKLIRKLKPSSCVELGTCFGISAAYQVAALNLNGHGSLVTLEGSPEISRIAKETFNGLGLNNVTVITGPFRETTRSVFESSRPIDLFFNDGHHDGDAIIQYFNEVIPNMSDESMIVFDDISWSRGMRRAWTKIEADKRVTMSIDLYTMGIVFLGNKSVVKSAIRIPLQ